MVRSGTAQIRMVTVPKTVEVLCRLSSDRKADKEFPLPSPPIDNRRALH